MTTPQSQCTNLELSKKLRELGYPQESLFSWVCEKDLMISTDWEDGHNDKISAPTVAELGEMLGYPYSSGKMDDNKNWCCYQDLDCCEIEPMYADTEADARAKMLIYLLENKLIEL